MTNPRSGRPYMRAVANLKARGEVQYCWRQGPNCARVLYASLPAEHPNSITLGHLVAIEDGGSLLDPANHAPECTACNSGDGARRTNAKRARKAQPARSYRNPAYHR